MKAEPVILHQCEWVLDGLSGAKCVRINGKAYTYTLRPGEVELVTPSGEVYTVSRVACTCNDAKMRRRVTGCKHRESLRRLGLLARAAALKKQQPQEQGAAS
jgi:hypothetical protein